MPDPITAFIDPGARSALAVWRGVTLAHWAEVECHAWHPDRRVEALREALAALKREELAAAGPETWPSRDFASLSSDWPSAVTLYVEAQYIPQLDESEPVKGKRRRPKIPFTSVEKTIQNATSWRVCAAALGLTVCADGIAPASWQSEFGLLRWVNKQRPDRAVIAGRAAALVAEHCNARAAAHPDVVVAILGALHCHLPRLDEGSRAHFAWVDQASQGVTDG